MARPTDKGLISKSKLTAIAGHIRRLLGTSTTYSPDGIASALNGITRRTSSGTTTLNRSTISKIFPAGYYPYEHAVAHTLGTEGTPTALKSISNHVATVTPSVTNTEGYIAGGTHSGTAVTVSASDLGAVVPSGTKPITSNGTYDVTQYASAEVNVKDYIIPDAYEELAYIEATGTQWIDSDILPTQHNYIHAKLMLKGGTSSSYCPFVAAPPHVYALQFNGDGIMTPCWSVFSSGETNSYRSITKNAVVEVYSSSCINRSTAFSPNPVSGALVANWSNNGDNITPAVTFGIFARKNADGSSSYNVMGRIYWLEISNENGMVAKFIPSMRKSDSVIGLYDVVRNRFFTNSGSGNFTGGTLT